MRIGLKHLIGIVAVAGFIAVTFGTFAVLVEREIGSRGKWQRIHEDIMRGLPSYLGERREPEQPEEER